MPSPPPESQITLRRETNGSRTDSNSANSPELHTTVRVLDSLVAFYQHERMWVCRQRASLDTVLDPPEPDHSSSSSEDESTSHSPTSSSSASASRPQIVQVKDEPLESEPVPSSSKLLSPSRDPSPEASTSKTRWHSRKRDFRLKIHRMPARPRDRGHVRQILPPPGDSPRTSAREISPGNEVITRVRLTEEGDGVHILDMFESIVEARLESCQRINRLIKHANRRDVVFHGGVTTTAVLRRGLTLPHSSANSEV